MRNGKREARERSGAADKTPTPADLQGLCVVLFGMPAAGKSSLLGALLQAAQTQPGLLGGGLKDQSGGLEILQQRLYQDKSQETLDEIVPYPVTFQPQDGAGKPVEATLIDCDGRIAYTYLSGQKALGATQGHMDLAAAIEEADTLLLVVDASAEPEQLKHDFVQFGQFLKLLEEHRGRDAEVAGLPVYLVLSKCDLLARPNDTSSQWLQRIEEGKRKISQRFKDFLAEKAGHEKATFGDIDLRVWATAVKRPTLADKPARPTEPFGVAELFRQCLASGLSFTKTRQKAERRLQVALVAIVGVLFLLIAAGAFFFFSRPSSELSALESQARAALPTEDATTKERLRGSLDEKIKPLDKVLKHPEFAKLPEILKDRVHTTYQELKTYQDLSQRFKESDRALAEINKEETLLALDKSLRAIQIPEIYVEQWKTTDLTQGLETRREQVGVFRLRVAETEGMIRKRTKEADRLLEERPKNAEDPKTLVWLRAVREFFKTQIPSPVTLVPGLPDVPYRRIYEFSTIEGVVTSLQVVEEQLQGAHKRVLDLLK